MKTKGQNDADEENLVGGLQVLRCKQILSRSESRQDFRQFLSKAETLDEFRYEIDSSQSRR